MQTSKKITFVPGQNYVTFLNLIFCNDHACILKSILQGIVHKKQPTIIICLPRLWVCDKPCLRRKIFKKMNIVTDYKQKL